jgi:hypothetical protein
MEGSASQMESVPRYSVETLFPGDSLDEWDLLVDASPQGSVFCRSWWLRAVCQDRFRICTLRKGGRLVAGIPLPVSRMAGLSTITMPPLTQTLGPVLLPSSKTTYEGRLSDEMEVLEELVAAMPRYHVFSMHFHYSLANWLPFYWAGYQQTTRYTYIIPDLTDLNAVFSGFSHSKKGNIKKAEGLVTVHADMAPTDFYENHKMTLRKQGETISYSCDLFKRIHEAACQKSGCKTFYALDRNDNIHAAIFIIFDRKSACYLISSLDPDYRTSGSATLLLREAMAYVSQYTKVFNLEGSMIKGVENSFRKLGGIQTPYSRISKDAAPPPVGLCLAMAAGLRKLWPKARTRLRRESGDA